MSNKTLIQEYRGFEIYFDSELEKFYCLSDRHDTESTSKSFSSIKKWIDDFIKENVDFKPFKVSKLDRMFDSTKAITILGIRKDGRFIYENDGKMQTVSVYDHDKYCLILPENEPLLQEIDSLEKEMRALQQKINEVSSKLKRVSLNDVKRQYTSQ